MKAIQDAASMVFIVAVEILAFVSVLGIWEIFGGDVIEKSLQTIGLLLVVCAVVIFAGRFIDNRSTQEALPAPHPLFKSVRQLTLGVLIACAALLALIGVLTIWEVIANGEVLYKSLGTLAILAFAAFVIVIACLERERLLGFSGESRSWTWGSAIGVLVLIWILSSLMGMFRYY